MIVIPPLKDEDFPEMDFGKHPEIGFGIILVIMIIFVGWIVYEFILPYYHVQL